MAINLKTAQLQVFSLAGAGVSIGDNFMTLVSFNQINGTPLTMSNFGIVGYGTVQPSQGTSEEQISFSGITNNIDGTVTLTGIKTVLDVFPYTETPNFAMDHVGGVSFVISNTAAYQNTFANKNNDETITQTWTFTPAKNPKYASQPATFAGLDLIDMQFVDTGVYGYYTDTGAASAIVITPSPVVTSYVTGLKFYIKVANSNAGATTINVNGLGAKALLKQVSTPLSANDILAGQLINVMYDGTNFQLIGGASTSGGNTTVYGSILTTRIYNDASNLQTIPHGLGLTPKKLNITATVADNGGTAPQNSFSFGTYLPLTPSVNSIFSNITTVLAPQYGNSTIYIVQIYNGFNGTDGQVATVTMDAVNIYLNWTNIGGGFNFGTAQLLLEYQA